MGPIAVQRSSTSPGRPDMASRPASSPPLEELLTADDLEKQEEAGRHVLKPAAVLLLVVNHPGDPTVVFTQRTAHLADHAGQISFPGGRSDESDGTPARTALRPAEEEVGIPAHRAEYLGPLPAYPTPTHHPVPPLV